MKAHYPSVYTWGLGLLVSLWMIFPFLIGPLSILFFLLVLFGIFQKQLQFKFNFLLLLVFLYFPFYALYCIHSDHPQEAMFGLEKKLSFVIYPIIFSFVPTFDIQRRRIENFFLTSLFFLLALSFIYALSNYFTEGNSALLFSSHFSPIHHPTYVSVFCSLGIYLLFKRWQKSDFRIIQIRLILGILLLLYVHIHLESLAGLLFTIALMTYLMLAWSYSRFGKLATIIVTFSGGFCLLMVLVAIPSLKSNLIDTVHFVRDYIKDPVAYTKVPRGEIRGNDARLLLWTASGEILAHHPNGVGSGEAVRVLNAKLHSNGQHNLANEQLNPHNQFLHVAVETGWIGLIYFIMLIKFIWWSAKRHKDGLLMVLVTVIGFNCLFESIMERQSGVVFFVLWASLLLGFNSLFKKQENVT